MSNIRTDNIIIAVPKGRILEELVPLMKKANIIPEQGFFDSKNIEKEKPIEYIR